ncbi:MAG: hypothetical protein CMF62_02095 [Magnetococcales bacterium]|nr:hypothetical protein [Magnetococcales bacterium]|tara:strand:- start:156359 stop:156979 length:621 start_codon:yes stop_codon:yes gene_type:complete
MDNQLFNWNDSIPEDSIGFESNNSDEYKDYRIEDGNVRGIPSNGEWEIIKPDGSVEKSQVASLIDNENFYDTRGEFCNNKDSISQSESTNVLPQNEIVEDTEESKLDNFNISEINDLNKNKRLSKYIKLRRELIEEILKNNINKNPNMYLDTVEQIISSNPDILIQEPTNYFESYKMSDSWWIDIGLKILIVILIIILGYRTLSKN